MEGWKERGKVKERDGGVENMRERDSVERKCERWMGGRESGWGWKEGEKARGGGRRERK